MDVNEVIDRARDAFSVRRVFGEPIQQGAVTLIPAARVTGGGGGGGGEGPVAEGAQGAESTGKGYGSGFGLNARPAGAFVLRNGKVRWMPAVDVNRIILGAQLLVGLVLLTFGQRLARYLFQEGKLPRRRHLARRAALR
ncbi:MAG TPA: spore germination protein GerW family protein [Archangium sp.]|uniref:GerW family sporulation protein n=1 Tax=Archangium sp. TaxID=1872627 RepID=UPI002E334E7F|nr:spore germination protein GerW family protein [Archangium sp.]HEX5753280.1 spore germination protein GerW family protein [Archangium sp.]